MEEKKPKKIMSNYGYGTFLAAVVGYVQYLQAHDVELATTVARTELDYEKSGVYEIGLFRPRHSNSGDVYLGICYGHDMMPYYVGKNGNILTTAEILCMGYRLRGKKCIGR